MTNESRPIQYNSMFSLIISNSNRVPHVNWIQLNFKSISIQFIPNFSILFLAFDTQFNFLPITNEFMAIQWLFIFMIQFIQFNSIYSIQFNSIYSIQSIQFNLFNSIYSIKSIQFTWFNSIQFNSDWTVIGGADRFRRCRHGARLQQRQQQIVHHLVLIYQQPTVQQLATTTTTTTEAGGSEHHQSVRLSIARRQGQFAQSGVRLRRRIRFVQKHFPRRNNYFKSISIQIPISIANCEWMNRKRRRNGRRRTGSTDWRPTAFCCCGPKANSTAERHSPASGSKSRSAAPSTTSGTHVRPLKRNHK